MLLARSQFHRGGRTAAGRGLLHAGRGVRKDARFVPLALVPITSGIQQISEGFVWLGLNRDDGALLQQSSVVFLFFAIAFWPFWIPMCLAIAEFVRRPQQITSGRCWRWSAWPGCGSTSRYSSIRPSGSPPKSRGIRSATTSGKYPPLCWRHEPFGGSGICWSSLCRFRWQSSILAETVGRTSAAA